LPSIEDLRQQVLTSIRETRASLRAYMTETGQRPTFILDGPIALPDQELLAECTILRTREELLMRLPKHGIMGEVGTLHGDFAVQIMRSCEPKELHIIDIGFNNLNRENEVALRSYGCEFHEGLSWEMISRFPDRYFDVLYIDADHSFDAVVKDLEQASRAVREGGLIVCNDYTLWGLWDFRPYGVIQAVNALANKLRLPFVYFALQVSGYYDVALRTT
jgi:predicted O-methyltransferase YrrM